MRRMTRIIACICIVAMLVIGTVIMPVNVEATEIKDLTVCYESLKMSDYWNAGGIKAPTKEGYIFGGWFTSDDEMTYTALVEDNLTVDSVKALTNTYVKNYKVSTDIKTTAEYVFKFKETIGNKIRIEGSNFNIADGEYGMQLTEIAVYGDAAIGNYILPLNNYVSSATDITTSSTLEDFGFFTLYLTDGDVKTGYSSNQHTDTNNTEWIEMDLKRSLSIGSILLKPAIGGSGFPVDFEIQVMMDGKWETIHKVTDYKKPVDESWQQFVLDKQYKTDKVRIWVTKLGDDFGQYSLRLNEIEIYPSEVKDKDMEAVEVGNIEHSSYNSAHTVETKTIIPTALIVSGVVVAATAFIGIVGVYILTLRKMKRKEK